jgi:hypothetical protein
MAGLTVLRSQNEMVTAHKPPAGGLKQRGRRLQGVGAGRECADAPWVYALEKVPDCSRRQFSIDMETHFLESHPAAW